MSSEREEGLEPPEAHAEEGASAYSFRRAHEAGAFQQAGLLTDDQFGKEAKARGASLSFGSTLLRRLEELDQAGALRPVAFLGADDEIVFREEREFTPWANYALDGVARRPRARYSHWQLLYVRDAIDLGQARMSVDLFLDEERRRNVHESYTSFYTFQAARWRALDDEWRPYVLLLVRLQNRYFPLIRGSLNRITTTMVFDAERGDYVDPYRKTVEEFNPPAVLAELALTAEQVQGMYDRLRQHGITRDPLRKFHMLFRMAPHRERAKLEGAARQAQDAFDAAEMMRRFYYDLTGELLATPDEMFDLTGGRWKEELFGHPPRLNYTRDDLQVELTRHHLYPHNVHLVVEGETDELVFRSLIEALAGPPSDLGITFSNLDGIGRTRLHAKILRAAKSHTRFPVLIVDREADIERDIELLKAEGLLDDETVFLWAESLEADNLSCDELVATAREIAREKGCELVLDAETLETAYRSQRERVGKKAPGLAEVLLKLARDRDVPISKKELADGITRLLVAELNEDGEGDARAPRRVVEIVSTILGAT
jgi:hypothetical protein